MAECAPGLEEALAGAGFELQGRYPVMTLLATALREVPAPDGVVIARVLGGVDARALLQTAAEAFGDGPPTDAQVAGYAGRGLLARAGGEPAGAAFRSDIAEGVSELGGIGVRERFRRRGIAAALDGGRRGRRRCRRRRAVLPDSRRRRRRTRLRARRLRPGGHDGRAHGGLRTFARGRRPLR